VLPHERVIIANFRVDAATNQGCRLSANMPLGQFLRALILVASVVDGLSVSHEAFIGSDGPLLPQPRDFSRAGGFVVQDAGFDGELFPVELPRRPLNVDMGILAA